MLYDFHKSSSSAATPRVFLHGAACSKNCWERVIDNQMKMADVLMIAWPGHNNHRLSPSDQYPASITAFSEYVLEALTECGLEKVDLIGHSLGGIVALDIVRQQPKRVRRVVAAAANARPAPQNGETIEKFCENFLQRAQEKITEGMEPQADEQARRRLNNPVGREELVIQVKNAIIACDPAAYLGMTKALAEEWLSGALREKLPHITLPVHVFAPRNNYPFANVEEMATLLGNAILHEISGSHMCFLDEHDEFVEQLNKVLA